MRYKRKTNTVVEGVSKRGEVSPKGVVAHTEDWDGRVAATLGPVAIRYVREPDGHIRPMTMQEMIDRGYFVVARGPVGVRRIREGIQ